MSFILVGIIVITSVRGLLITLTKVSAAVCILHRVIWGLAGMIHELYKILSMIVFYVYVYVIIPLGVLLLIYKHEA